MSDNGGRPLGRPKDGDSAETLQRLLQVAQAAFSKAGYDGTTNREIAVAAGITSGAIYHYFPSKCDLYASVYAAMLARVFADFEAAIAERDTLIEQFSAVLDRTVELNRNDPTVTGFVVAMSSDIRRHPELYDRLRSSRQISERFYSRLVAAAVDRGEIPASKARAVQDLITAVLAGLARFSRQTNDSRRHAEAVEVLKQFLAGTLVAT